MKGVLAGALVWVAVLGGGAAEAQELRVDLRIDLPITLGGAVALAGAEVYKDSQAPLPCAWCDRDADGRDTLNVVDRAVRKLRWSKPHVAGLLSDATCFFLTPLAAGGTEAIAAAHDGRGGGTGHDLLVVAEAAVLAANVNEVVKLLVRRERPPVHAYRAQKPPEGGATSTWEASVEDDLSFYSGHTTGAVTLAVAAGTVASLRGYGLAPLVWAAGLPPALVTGYLRIAADRHYFTDVLTGALAGALIGALVPCLFHAPSSSPDPSVMAVSPGTPGGAASAGASLGSGLFAWSGAF